MVHFKQNPGKIVVDKTHQETFSGYTMALLSSVIKFTCNLRETKERLQIEWKTQDLLSTSVSDLKIYVHVLTSDLIQIQDINWNPSLLSPPMAKIVGKTELFAYNCLQINYYN